jgi:hypothetical protein
MKTLLPLLVAAVLFAGCERIEGQLNVSKDVKLQNTRGNTRTIRVGTYSADIKANTKKKITLRLNNESDEKYEFNIPKGSIPTNGSFAYKSAVVGQPVDLSGTVATRVTDSGMRQGTESCQYQVPVQTCFPTPNGGMSCSTHMETRFGSRWIQYFDRTTDKDVALSIAVVNTSEEAAQFTGHATWVERIVTNATSCR